MSLHVIIGYPDSACKGLPFPVYCGPSLTEAQVHKDRHNSTAASFMEFRNASGLRKNNPNFKPAPPPAPVEVEVPVTKPKKGH